MDVINLNTVGVVDGEKLQPPTEQPAGTPAVATGTEATPQPTGTPAPVTPETTAPAATPEAAPTQTEADWFKVEEFNKRFGAQAKDVGEVENMIRSLNENKEYLDKKNVYVAYEKAYQELVDNLDKKYQAEFPTPEAERAYHLKKSLLENGNRDEGIVNKIVYGDFGKMPALDVLALEMQYDAPTLAGKEDITKMSVLKDFGVDLEDPGFNVNDPASWKMSDVDKARMEAKAARSRSNFEAAKRNVTIPEKRNYKAEFETQVKQREDAQKKMTEDWTTKAKDIVNGFMKWEHRSKGPDGADIVDFTYEVPKEFLRDAVPHLVEWAVQNGIQPTAEGVQQAIVELREAFEGVHNTVIMEAYAKEKVAAAEEKLRQKYENPKPINTTEAPPNYTKSFEDEVNERFKQGYNLK